MSSEIVELSSNIPTSSKIHHSSGENRGEKSKTKDSKLLSPKKVSLLALLERCNKEDIDDVAELLEKKRKKARKKKKKKRKHKNRQSTSDNEEDGQNCSTTSASKSHKKSKIKKKSLPVCITLSGSDDSGDSSSSKISRHKKRKRSLSQCEPEERQSISHTESPYRRSKAKRRSRTKSRSITRERNLSGRNERSRANRPSLRERSKSRTPLRECIRNWEEMLNAPLGSNRNALQSSCSRSPKKDLFPVSRVVKDFLDASTSPATDVEKCSTFTDPRMSFPPSTEVSNGFTTLPKTNESIFFPAVPETEGVEPEEAIELDELTFVNPALREKLLRNRTSGDVPLPETPEIIEPTKKAQIDEHLDDESYSSPSPLSRESSSPANDLSNNIDIGSPLVDEIEEDAPMVICGNSEENDILFDREVHHSVATMSSNKSNEDGSKLNPVISCKDSFLANLFEDLKKSSAYSSRLDLLCDGEAAEIESVIEALKRLPCTRRIEPQGYQEYLKISIEFQDLFYAVMFYKLALPDLSVAIKRLSWKPESLPPLKFPGMNFTVVCVSMRSLAKYSVDYGVERIPVRISLNTRSGFLNSSLRPSSGDLSIFEDLGCSVHGDYVTYKEETLTLGDECRPQQYLIQLVSEIVKGLTTLGADSGKYLFVFKSWNEARLFQKLVEQHGLGCGVEKFIVYLGVLDNHRLGLNLNSGSNLTDKLNTYEECIRYRFSLREYITDQRLAYNFLSQNCISVEKGNLASLSLPSVIGEIFCFLVLQYVQVEKDYFLSLLDINISDLRSTNFNLSLPVLIPGLDPARLFRQYNRALNQVELCDGGQACDLLSEKTALNMFLDRLNNLSKGKATLVVFNEYLTLPPLLSALRRHSLVKEFYSSFTAIIDSSRKFRKTSRDSFLGLKTVVKDGKSKDGSTLFASVLQSWFQTSAKEFFPLAKPIDSLRFSEDDARMYFLTTKSESVCIRGQSKKEIDFQLSSEYRGLGFEEERVVLLDLKVIKHVDIAFAVPSRGENHLKLIFKNQGQESVRISLKNKIVGSFQPNPDKIPIPRLIPHLSGRSGVIHSTEDILVINSKCSNLRSRVGSTQMVEEVDLTLDLPATLTFNDVIIAAFKYDGGWFFQAEFRSILLRRPNLQVIVHPDTDYCENCRSFSVLHESSTCPSIRSCSCEYIPAHTRRRCRNPVCWNCGDHHTWDNCPSPALDDEMKSKTKLGYTFLKEKIVFDRKTCVTRSKALKLFKEKYPGRKNLLVGLKIHHLLKILFSEQEVVETECLSGVVDTSWIHKPFQTNLKKHDTLSLEELESIVSPQIRHLDKVKRQVTQLSDILGMKCEYDELKEKMKRQFEEKENTKERKVNHNRKDIINEKTDDHDMIMLDKDKVITLDKDDVITLDKDDVITLDRDDVITLDKDDVITLDRDDVITLDKDEIIMLDKDDDSSGLAGSIPRSDRPSEQIDLSRLSDFKSLRCHPEFSNFALAYTRTRAGKPLKPHECDAIIDHLTNSMKLETVEPLLELIRLKTINIDDPEDIINVIKVEYPTFCDKLISTQTAVSVLLLMINNLSGLRK